MRRISYSTYLLASKYEEIEYQDNDIVEVVATKEDRICYFWVKVS